ncbi:hypothetical protein KL86PLE_130275 [uncultured Pleomorphomonas sp.]|uniref:Uncharacterized protein n=1 Tax=uncultured Pleomorphomonas sp. TaxID=442121 RepID=A0A212LB73_9HYPH|nr:hypothetical protein KL86PLE_130275 [uncultured Pleomorphomonas sp.]
MAYGSGNSRDKDPMSHYAAPVFAVAPMLDWTEIRN